jgi:dihydroorotate dehydrogenase (NAD+) catalytic subunit
LDSQEIKNYFSVIENDLDNKHNNSASLIRYDIDMNFRPYTLVSNEKITGDIAILTFDQKLEVSAGEFVYTWIPGIGEKPFSALTDDPFSLVVIDVGIFTHHLMQLKAGDKVLVRGPHGRPVAPPESSRLMAVAGGTGLAAVYQIARDFGNADIFMGARSRDRLYFADECRVFAEVHIATDDGSEGFHGLVTELLEAKISRLPQAERDKLVFYNCGPEPMVHAAEHVERKFVSTDRIFSAIDYMTKCGVGICGACHSPDGRRLCVDGPFMSPQDACPG